MNVKQLREALDAYPDDLEILIARDEEGNGFNRFYEAGQYYVHKNEDKHGYIEDVQHIEDINSEGYDLDDYEPRLVFWP